MCAVETAIQSTRCGEGSRLISGVMHMEVAVSTLALRI
jgi:hypothetical protein